jgi:hypothetical protein
MGQILPNLAQEIEALKAELVATKAALAAKDVARARAITMKVSEKGAISVYGLGRWPVTLYRTQMERLLKVQPEIEAFIAANASLLTVKEG